LIQIVNVQFLGVFFWWWWV